MAHLDTLRALNEAREEIITLKQENERLRKKLDTPPQAVTRNTYDAGDTTAIDRFRAASPLSRL